MFRNVQEMLRKEMLRKEMFRNVQEMFRKEMFRKACAGPNWSGEMETLLNRDYD